MLKHVSLLTLSTAVLLSACSVSNTCSEGKCTTCSSCAKDTPITTSYFAFDSSLLTPEDTHALDGVAKHLRENPTEKVKVCGFTDSTGPASYNQELSLKRATSAANYLEAKGISRDRIKIRGFGATRFADNNDTATGRAKNRRVEVRYFK